MSTVGPWNSASVVSFGGGRRSQVCHPCRALHPQTPGRCHPSGSRCPHGSLRDMGYTIDAAGNIVDESTGAVIVGAQQQGAPPAYSSSATAGSTTRPAWMSPAATHTSVDGPPDLAFARRMHPGITDTSLLQSFLDMYREQYNNHQITTYRDAATAAGIPEARINAAIAGMTGGAQYLAGAAVTAPAPPAPVTGLFGPPSGSAAPPPAPTVRTTQGIVLGSAAITNRRTVGADACETALAVQLTPANLTSLINSRGLTNYLGLAHIALGFVAPADLTGMSATVIFIFHNAAITAPTTLAQARLSPGRVHEMSLTAAPLSSQTTTAQLNYSPPFSPTDTLHICVVIRAWGASTATSGATAVQVGAFNFTIGANTN